MSRPPSKLSSQIVRAGAGAGKTAGLITEVVRRFHDSKAENGRAPRIVVTTFTRKATQELRERLLVQACRDKRPDLIEYMSDGTKLHISTIHGLLSLFLRQIAHLTDMDPGFQVLDERASLILRKQVLREVLASTKSSTEWLEEWSFDDILQLCEQWGRAHTRYPDLKPASITQLKAATQGHAAHVRKMIGELADTVLESVDHPKWIEWASQLRETAESWNGDHNALELPRKPNKVDGFEDFEKHIKRMRDRISRVCGNPAWQEDLWPAMITSWEKFQPLAKIVDEKIRERKTQRGQLDMEDLELRALDILRNKPFLAESFAGKWDVWLIDEFQDTSEIQFEILGKLRGGKDVYYVGDPQQSIYLFRHAQPEIFNEQWLRMTKNERKELQDNHRSEAPLLHFINDIVADLGSPFQKMFPQKGLDMPATTVAGTVLRAATVEVEREQLVQEVIELVEQKVKFHQICVLGRTHSHLMDLATLLKARGLPTHVHSPSGFWKRRETQDIYSLWRFLINPHNNENLIALLRTPYFFVPDVEIAEHMKARPNSLWRKFSVVENPGDSLTILRQAQKISEEIGLVAALEWALLESGVFDLALQNDPAGRKESNLWKFLIRVKQLEREGGAGFLSMEPTVQDEEASTEGDAATSQEPNCINLMTIHGAKGLQFDYVIVPHMGYMSPFADTPQFQAENGVFSFKAIEDEDGNSISSPLERIWMTRQREREREEHKRLLYVAVTRARKRLWLSASEVAEDSWASMLSAFARPAGHWKTAHYTLDVRDVQAVTGQRRTAATKETPVREMFMKSSRLPSLLRRSVTEMLGDSDTNKTPPKIVFAVAKKKSEGVLIHRILEALRYGHPPADLKSPRIRKAVDFVQTLKTPPMSELLKTGEAEWGFQVQTQNGLLEGQIDLWGRAAGELWIIDYKSGSEDYKEKAFEQLSLYAWALQQFGHKEKIKLAVIYPLSEKLEVREFTTASALYWEDKFRLSQ